MNFQKLNSSCRRAISRSIPPTISKSTNRSKWTYKSDEPLVLSRLVIDLDAPDNPAVRDYDEIKDNTPSRHQQQIIRSTEKAIARRTQLVKKQLKEGVEGFPRKRNRKNQRTRDDALEHELAYNPHAAPPPVTAMDLMTYALLGNPFSARASKEPANTRDIHMEKLFNAHNIDYKDTANMTVRALTEDFDIKTDGKVVETVLDTQGNLNAVQRRNARIKELRDEKQRHEELKLEEQKKAKNEDQIED